jgi:hypothetical protein
LHYNTLFVIACISATACAGIFVTYVSFLQTTGAIPAFAQINNNTAPDITTPSINASLPIGGLNLLLYTKSGGQAHLNQLYTLNAVSQELVFVDLANNTVKKRMLTDDEMSNVTDIFWTTAVPENTYHINPCPDCIQYGLLSSFFEFEKRIEFDELSFWTDRTPGTEGLTRLGQTIEDLAGRQMTNANTTLASVK